jgi:hypothetical protein
MAAVRKPLLAAVEGIAVSLVNLRTPYIYMTLTIPRCQFGGGFELALMVGATLHSIFGVLIPFCTKPSLTRRVELV